VRVEHVATGLWRWTGLHPGWTRADAGPAGWEREVGCVYYEMPDAIVLIDPLVPPEAADRFLEALDRDVARARGRVRILLTTERHRRSADALQARYEASAGDLPPGVEVAASVRDERVFWLLDAAALVFGDVVVGREGGLQIPRSRIGDAADAAIAALRPLLDLPVERVLVGHGEPVLAAARAALARALS
jgi:glyoxylase-like metal-dependent hydrolase (beta-lactamase superfamily II)